MIDPAETPRDAIDWHQRLGARFAERYETSPAFHERARVWADLIETHLRPEDHVLDAGCGPGVLACIAARRCVRVTALDASANMLAAAQDAAAEANAANIDFCHGRIGDAALLAEQRFDAILCSSVLEYVEDLGGALDWLVARLAPGGALLVSMPNGHALYRRLERLLFLLMRRPLYYAFVRHVPRAGEFEALLLARGLRAADLRYYAGPRVLRRLAPAEQWAETVENLFVIVARKGSEQSANGPDRLTAPRWRQTRIERGRGADGGEQQAGQNKAQGGMRIDDV